MSTQYDTIGSTYAGMKQLPTGLLEEHNLRKNSLPYIHNARVLDFACGTGHYTRLAAQWGAASVLGFDISPVMVSSARKSTTNPSITFETADVASKQVFPGSPFDVVLGSWVLNYASSGNKMAAMFRTAFLNLKEGGRFVCIVPHPSEEPRKQMERALVARSAESQGDYWITMTPTGDVADEGVGTRIDAMTKTGFVNFEAFHLRKSVFETAAKNGGFEGGVSWRKVTSLDEWEDDWRSYCSCPHFGVLEVTKTGGDTEKVGEERRDGGIVDRIRSLLNALTSRVMALVKRFTSSPKPIQEPKGQ